MLAGGNGGWQPMDTAPRDGTPIIGWYGDHYTIVAWREGGEWVNRRRTGRTVWFWSSGYNRHPEPDCWQPVPAAPQIAKAA